MHKSSHPLDNLITVMQTGLISCFSNPDCERASPAADCPPPQLDAAQTKTSSGLMRINHTGEVCAQALYQGQALATNNTTLRQTLEQSAREENDHLNWCRSRLDNLGTHSSYLNPFWYTGSFALGYIAGLLDDKWNLGFLAETEQQVCQHIDSHLKKLPQEDVPSRYILEQMRLDEEKHATIAIQAGAAELPKSVKWLMQGMSKVMTTLSYHL